MKRFMFLAAIVMAVVFTSCKKEDATISENDLTGTWVTVHESGYEIETGNKETWDYTIPAAEQTILTFNSDKTGVINDEGERSTFTWSVIGDNILNIVSNSASSSNWTIPSLTSRKMVIEMSIKYTGYEYYERVTFEKVN